MFINRNYPLNISEDHKCYFDPVLSIHLPKPSYQICKYVLLLENAIIFSKRGKVLQSLLYDSRLNEPGQ